tara:strand:+ start:2834 stop:3964 length:1131 start_codon:yes stop_codon:yes gene_type:complete
MPFYNYTINEKLLKNINKINQNSLENFYHNIVDLNYRQKAIFINNKKLDLKSKLYKKISEISKYNLDLNKQLIKELLTKVLLEINKSILCEISDDEINKIVVDFEKDHENLIDQEKKDIVISGDFYPEYFDLKVNRFIKEFLNKIKLYAYSKYIKNEKIDKIYIYHKELSSYLLPDEKSIFSNSIEKFIGNLKKDYNDKGDIKRNSKDKISSITKIKNGTDVLVEWWISIPKEYRPKLKILSDVPKSIKKYSLVNRTEIKITEIKMLEKKIANFFELDKIKPDVELIWQKDMPGKLWWQHKRHWIFVPKLKKNQVGKIESFDLLAIKHDYGVEFIDEEDKNKLRRDMELKVISNKNIHHMRDIKNHLILEESFNID